MTIPFREILVNWVFYCHFIEQLSKGPLVEKIKLTV